MHNNVYFGQKNNEIFIELLQVEQIRTSYKTGFNNKISQNCITILSVFFYI